MRPAHTPRPNAQLSMQSPPTIDGACSAHAYMHRQHVAACKRWASPTCEPGTRVARYHDPTLRR
eukprot:4745900-Alexandrium_andersonii.AAC.1